MTAQEMWSEYCHAMGLADAAYEAWAFGAAADDLAALVARGEKRATSSAGALYRLEGEPLPRAGDKSVILNSRDEAVCIIENTRVTVQPYDRVTEEMAALEGEGDKSLGYWRQVHEAFFRDGLAQAGLVFSADMPVVFEEFRVVWPVKNG